jgi:hypothetical protein
LLPHTPDALHVCGPQHVSGSSADFTATHAPVASHVWQVPLQAAEQQFSSQMPLAHWLVAVHALPTFKRHVPNESQVLVPVHVSASSADLTATHAPDE